MNITNEKLYEMIVEMKSEIADFKSEVASEIAAVKTAQADFKAEIVAEIAAVKTAQSELRADISKWGVALFLGSMVAMTSIISVFLASVVLTIP